METMYFAKKPGKKYAYQQSMKNVDWSKFGEEQEDEG